MIKITYKQFIDYLLKGPKAVYADFLIDQYLYYREEYEDADDQTSFYYGDGAVIEYTSFRRKNRPQFNIKCIFTAFRYTMVL